MDNNVIEKWKERHKRYPPGAPLQTCLNDMFDNIVDLKNRVEKLEGKKTIDLGVSTNNVSPAEYQRLKKISLNMHTLCGT